MQFIDFDTKKPGINIEYYKVYGGKNQEETDIAHIEMFFGLWYSIKVSES